MDLLSTVAFAGSVAAAALALVVHQSWAHFSARNKIVSVWALALIVVIAGFLLVTLATRTSRSNLEWDFLAFWTPARVASQGGNFYDPRELAAVELPFAVSRDFEREVLDGGSSYPPPSMLLFAPFGFFPFRTAYALWYVVQGISLLLAIRLLLGLAPKPRRAIDQCLVALLVVTGIPTLINVSNAQTQFVVLLLLGSVFLSKDGSLRGAALALAILLKPYVAILLLPTVRYKQTRTLIGTGITLAGAAIASVLFWGPEIFGGYLQRTSSLPISLFGQIQNQSWAGLVARNFAEGGQSPLEHPLFWLGVTLVGSLCCYRLLKQSESGSVWLLVLLTGLLIYPATLNHYLVVLTLPLLYLWFHQVKLRIHPKVALPFVLGPIVLMATSSGELGFWSLVVMWLAFFSLSGFDRDGFEIETGSSTPHRKTPTTRTLKVPTEGNPQ